MAVISGRPAATIVRVFDALLDGKDNYEADRAVRDRLLEIDPSFAAACWDIKHFGARVVRYLAGHVGINQFLDCGPALPYGENTHDIALRLNPESSVVYVSTDPLVLAYGRALLADNDRTHMADVNITRPKRVFANPIITKHLDFSQPLALLHVTTLHHFPDSFDPWQAMAEFIDRLAPGSYVAMAHAVDPGPEHELGHVAAEVRDLYATAVEGFGAWFRPMDRIEALLPGLEVLEPGLVPLSEWWPDGPRDRPLGAMQRLFVGGVGRKP
jgi:SAM-dependent methyltransferase